MRVGRNEACPCGSKKKYKACCAQKSNRGASQGLILLIGLIAAIAAAGVIAAIWSKDTPQTTPAAAASKPNNPRPQPPGPVPAGKVWSVEHGHWHDAATSAATTTPAATPPTTTTQPQPGPAPEGKVWSPEHGHWHDAPKK